MRTEPSHIIQFRISLFFFLLTLIGFTHKEEKKRENYNHLKISPYNKKKSRRKYFQTNVSLTQ